MATLFFAASTFAAEQRVPRQMPVARTRSGAPAAAIGRPSQRFDPASLLVRFKPGTPADLKAQARGAIHGQRLRAYSLVRDLEQVSIGPGLDVLSAIAILGRMPFVEYAHPNYVIVAVNTPNDEYFDEQWALHNWGQDSMFFVWLGGTPDANIDAPEAWDTTTSSNAVVAILDTGIEWLHPDLGSNIWINPGEVANNGIDDDGNGYVDDFRGWDFVNHDYDPVDGHGHGSHVAGIVAAEGNNGIGVSGIVWHGKVMAVKVIGDDGTGLLADAVAGLEYAVANGAKISNASWGYYTFAGEEAAHQALYDAIAAAQASNHLFVTAAGNDTLNTDLPGNTFYPAGFALDNIISVAATDNTDALAYFSNYGPATVDIGAPGVDVFSTWKYNCGFFICDYDYAWESGTSMASPHVAGVAALVYGRHPSWTYGQVRDRIFTSARPIAALQGMTVTGGVVNAAAALVEPVSTPPAAPSNLQATAIAFNRIDVAWTDNSTDEDGFRVERSLDGINWALVFTTGANATSYSDTTVAGQTTYQYRVSAFNASGSSAPSNVASATTPAAPAPPAAPTGLVAAASAYDEIDLSWLDNSADENGFQIERSLDGVNWGLLATVAANATTYADASVSAQTTYWYRVRAFNGNGSSAYTNIASATTPPAPRNFVANGETAGAGTVSGTYVQTQTDDGAVEAITEILSGGKPDSRYSYLEHTWTIDAGIGGTLRFFADATENPLSDEDDFKFQVSATGVTYSDLCVVGADCAAGKALQPGLNRTIYIKIVDTDRTAGRNSLDTVQIDHIYIQSTAVTSFTITLTATAQKVSGVNQAVLSWSGATSTNVDIWRNGVILTTTPNDGSYTDAVTAKGSYTDTVCEAGGVAFCSAAKSVGF